jgi:hypothetical protein
MRRNLRHWTKVQLIVAQREDQKAERLRERSIQAAAANLNAARFE